MNTVAKNIKALRIQGAQSIARAAVNELYLVYKKKPKQYKLVYKELVAARPTEPMLRNALAFLRHGIEKKQSAKTYQKLIKHFTGSNDLIAKHVATILKSKQTVYTHCHSHTVIKGIIKAKRIKVTNTETRPLYQGRQTAKDLAKHGIKVTHYVDSAMRLAIKQADVVLLGADAILANGDVINKIGSELVCLLAKYYKKPVYICTNAWKYDPKTRFGFEEIIEKRHSAEVWKKPPKNVKISNYAFEKIDRKLITGMITEMGMISPKDVKVILAAYPWMKKL